MIRTWSWSTLGVVHVLTHYMLLYIVWETVLSADPFLHTTRSVCWKGSQEAQAAPPTQNLDHFEHLLYYKYYHAIILVKDGDDDDYKDDVDNGGVMNFHDGDNNDNSPLSIFRLVGHAQSNSRRGRGNLLYSFVFP